MMAAIRFRWLVALVILSALAALFMLYQNPLLELYLAEWGLC